MVVAGIDPGLAATGYGVVTRIGRELQCQDFGCIRTSAKVDAAERLRAIYDTLCGVFVQWRPELVVIEEAFAKDAAPKAAISIGQVCGVILLAACQSGCSVNWISARAAKQAITGAGSADKAQVEKSLRRLLGVSDEIRPDHAADAVGLAYVGALRWKG